MKTIAPERLFLLLALPFGLLLAFLIPPFGGGDEPHHFLRTYEVVTGQWLGHSEGPVSIKEFQKQGTGFIMDALRAKHYPSSNYAALAAISLSPDIRTEQNANPLFMGQFVLAYVFYAPGMVLGLLLSLKPLYILYLCRVTGMMFCTMLIYFAIRITPVGKYFFCTIALLPTTAFFRSYLNTDPITISAAFLFLACVLRSFCHDPASRGTHNLPTMLISSWLLPPLKVGYALLPLMGAFIPGRNDAKHWARIAWLVIPGMAIAALWLTILHFNIYHDMTYNTHAGNHVNSSEQLKYMIADPLTYAKKLTDYVFNFPNIVQWIIGMLGEVGWMALFLSIPALAPLIGGTVMIFLLDTAAPETYVRPRPAARFAAVAIFIFSALFIMTLIHMLFNPVGSATFITFQGRYFLPLLPLMIFLRQPKSTNQQALGWLVLVVGLFGLTCTAFKLYTFYW